MGSVGFRVQGLGLRVKGWEFPTVRAPLKGSIRVPLRGSYKGSAGFRV